MFKKESQNRGSFGLNHQQNSRLLIQRFFGVRYIVLLILKIMDLFKN